jgi:hypothetical protein
MVQNSQPNNVDALMRRIELARAFIAKEHADPGQEEHGDWIDPAARPAHDALCLCLQVLAASPSQPTSPSVDAQCDNSDACSTPAAMLSAQPTKIRSDNSSTARVTMLPENVRIPLHSVQADLEYLIGRVIADGSCGQMIIQSMRERLDQIEAAISAPRVEPVAWRSRRKDKDSEYWEAHSQDPTNAIAKYGSGGLEAYIIEPLYAAVPSQPDTGVRAAFRAGWYVNAAAEQPADYLSGCEEVDWKDYAKSAEVPTEKSTASWLWACTGCGSQKTMDQIKGEYPNVLSCCPERKMAPPAPPDTGSRKPALDPATGDKQTVCAHCNYPSGHSKHCPVSLGLIATGKEGA